MKQSKIDTNYEPWKAYNKPKDLIDTTHKLVRITTNCKIMKIAGINPLKMAIADIEFHNMSIEVSEVQGFEILKLMTKEVDATNRFLLIDGIIQGEFEIWDGDYEKRLYFSVDFTLLDAIKFAKQQEPVIGFSLARLPNVLVGGQTVFHIDDLWKIIKLKQIGDAKIIKPSHRWKVG